VRVSLFSLQRILVSVVKFFEHLPRRSLTVFPHLAPPSATSGLFIPHMVVRDATIPLKPGIGFRAP